MNTIKRGYYIASGFFNENQLGLVQRIEEHLGAHNVEFFSPRLETKMESGAKNKVENLVATYKGNVDGIDKYDKIVVVLDEKLDTGTLFELGYAISKKKDIKVILVGGRAQEFFEGYIKLRSFGGVKAYYISSYDRNCDPTLDQLIIKPTGVKFYGWGDDRIPEFFSQSELTRECYENYIYVFNAGNRKADHSISVEIGRCVSLGYEVVVYADDIKSANLMLALCTPYFVIGKENLETLIDNLRAGDKNTLGCMNLEELNII